MMKGVCLRYAHNETEAEDLLQEAFIRVFKSIDQFKNEGALGGWVRKLTVNLALETYRKNKTMQVHLKEFGLSKSEEIQLESALQNLHLNDLLTKIQQLPTGFRTIFNLYAIEGYTHVEISQLLSISVGTSKSQYSRARAFLKESLENEQKVETIKNMNYARG